MVGAVGDSDCSADSCAHETQMTSLSSLGWRSAGRFAVDCWVRTPGPRFRADALTSSIGLPSLTTLQRLIQQKVLESDSANRAAIEPIRTDHQQFLAGKGSDKPIELEWRSVTGLHFDPRSTLADEIDLVLFRTPEQRLKG